MWPLDRLVSDNLDAWQRNQLSQDLLAFGDDGTGNPFCLRLRDSDEVVRWSWIDLQAEQGEGTLLDFVSWWVKGVRQAGQIRFPTWNGRLHVPSRTLRNGTWPSNAATAERPG